MNHYPKLFMLGAASFAALLSACSGEPSSSEIEKSVMLQAEASNNAAKQIGGKFVTDDLLTKVHAVKKVGCAEAQGASGYNCDVEVDMTNPLVGRNKDIVQIRFVKGSDGWQATK